jgi:Uma2 family endonuclease
MEPLIKTLLSVEEYLALERVAETRNELLDGEMFAMSGASRRHNQIVVNLVAALHPRLRVQGCETYANDMRVRIPATDLFTYPDVAVVCGEPRFDDAEMDTLLNPKVILEVLSKTTESYDRGAKFEHYRTLASLTDYVLVAQDRPHVEHFSRQGENRWLLTEITEPSGALELTTLGCTLLLAEIYDRVRIEPGPGPKSVAVAAG